MDFVHNEFYFVLIDFTFSGIFGAEVSFADIEVGSEKFGPDGESIESAVVFSNIGG